MTGKWGKGKRDEGKRDEREKGGGKGKERDEGKRGKGKKKGERERDEREKKGRKGKGMKGKGCRFGKKSRKEYRLRMLPTTQKEFEKMYAQTPACKYCEGPTRRKHPHSCLPSKGSAQQRPHEEGKYNEAAANRVPPALAAKVAEAMKKAILHG